MALTGDNSGHPVARTVAGHVLGGQVVALTGDNGLPAPDTHRKKHTLVLSLTFWNVHSLDTRL